MADLRQDGGLAKASERGIERRIRNFVLRLYRLGQIKKLEKIHHGGHEERGFFRVRVPIKKIKSEPLRGFGISKKRSTKDF